MLITKDYDTFEESEMIKAKTNGGGGKEMKVN